MGGGSGFPYVCQTFGAARSAASEGALYPHRGHRIGCGLFYGDSVRQTVPAVLMGLDEDAVHPVVPATDIRGVIIVLCEKFAQGAAEIP